MIVRERFWRVISAGP